MAEDGARDVMLTPQVHVWRLPQAGFGVLRLGRARAEAAIAAAGVALGISLPVAPNRATGEAPRVLWTGPLEWSLIDAAPTQLAALQSALVGSLAHYAELSAGRVCFRISGPGAADLIESECPLDVRTISVDACAQSLFAGIGVLIERRESEDGFRLYADASLAEHLANWLVAAAGGLA